MRAPQLIGGLRAALVCAVVMLGACKGDAGTAPGTDYPYDVVFERRTGTTGAPDLYLRNLRTGAESRILATGVGGMQPAASPDGSRIAFVRTDAEFSGEIFIANRDGTNLRNLSNNPEADVMPAWSADGQRIAFVTDRAGVQDIFVINADGTGLARVTPPDPSPAVTYETWPSWSWSALSAQSLAYSSTIGGTADIWTTTVGATPAVSRTQTTDSDLHPSWSPDGKYIAFERRDATTGDADIAILTVSTGVVNVVHRPGQQINPAWSPEGTLIAYSSDEDGGGDFELYTMHFDATSAAVGDFIRRTDNSANDWRPTWLKRP